jgi:transcriptional regulator with XRE-family HTH domain
MVTTMPYIGERLKELRARRLLSQRDLAAEASLSPATIAKIETNKVEPNFTTLRKLTKALEVDPTELMGGD